MAPMIISGPDVKRRNEIHHGFVTLMYIAPTFYEAAGVTYPEAFDGNSVYPLRGASLMAFVSRNREQIHNADYVFAVEHWNRAMLIKGDWKITSSAKPFSIDNFGLYNLSNDLSESHDLRKSEPDKYDEMLREWRKFSDEVKVQVPVPVGGRRK